MTNESETVTRATVIRLLGVGDYTDDDIRAVVPTWVRDGYIAAYDPDLGIPSLVVTADRAHALKLGSREALDLWRSVPSGEPLRRDGLPNRPLTAFTVEVGP